MSWIFILLLIIFVLFLFKKNKDEEHYYKSPRLSRILTVLVILSFILLWIPSYWTVFNPSNSMVFYIHFILPCIGSAVTFFTTIFKRHRFRTAFLWLITSLIALFGLILIIIGNVF